VASLLRACQGLVTVAPSHAGHWRCAWAALLWLALGTATAAPAAPAPAPWGFTDRDDGISCPFFDVQLSAAWPNNRPQGVDAQGQLSGERPFAQDRIVPQDLARVRRLDLLPLVRAWWQGERPNDGLLVRTSRGGPVVFHSREDPDTAVRPQLVLTEASGRKRFVEPAADATLDCSTYRGLGRMGTLTARGDTWVALRFDLGPLIAASAAPPAAAELILVRTPQPAPVAATLDILAVQSPLGRPGVPRTDGIAQRYPRDQGIERDPDVLFADGFESRQLDRRWTPGMAVPLRWVDAGGGNGFEPLSGQALEVTVPRGQQLGLDLRYRFQDRHGSEPEEIHFRYYLRLSASWLAASDGGKLPGFAGTYGRAGWGGRPWDGNKGWSLRGAFARSPPVGHPASGSVMLGTYAYHSNASATYGEGFPWISSGLAGLVQPDRWYCVEQRVKMNSAGKTDGELEVWVNGQLAFTRRDLRLRDNLQIRIEEVWMNIFHGGTAPAPAPLHAYIDQLVIARRYIGPMRN
jgi:hypothetical protein